MSETTYLICCVIVGVGIYHAVIQLWTWIGVWLWKRWRRWRSPPFLISSGAELDRIAAMMNLERREGESDASLRRKLLKRMETLAGQASADLKRVCP